MTERGIAHNIYWRLRLNVGLEHHAVREIFRAHLPTIRVKDTLYRAYKDDRDLWSSQIDSAVAMSLHPDPNIAGRRLLRYVWPDYPKGDPTLPYTVTSQAMIRIVEANEWSVAERQRAWVRARKHLRRVKRDGLEAWDERLLATYLRVKTNL